MNTRKGFALCAVLVLLAVANVEAAQTRERGQDRHMQAKQGEQTKTTLFEQSGVPYVVMHVVGVPGAENCQIYMSDIATLTELIFVTNTGELTMIIVSVFSNPPPPELSNPDVVVPLRVEVEGAAQIYSIRVKPPDDASGWAEGYVPRVALRHLQSAVNSRGGFVVKVGGGEPFRLSVPQRAADAFRECGRGILRGRLDGAMDSLNRTLEGTPSR